MNEPEHNPQKNSQEIQIKNDFFCKYCYEVMHTCIHIHILIIGIFYVNNYKYCEKDDH